MKFHPSKCQLLRVTRKRHPIRYNYTVHDHTLEEVSEAKYLGVTLSNNLSWNTHIDMPTKKVHRTLGFLWRNLWQCPSSTKESCYNTLVQPITEFAATVWDPHTQCNIKKVESVQRKAARFVTNNHSRESSVTAMLKQLQWDTLAERRAKSKIHMIHRIQHNLVDITTTDLQPSVTTDEGCVTKYVVPYSRTVAHQSRFVPSSIRLWNRLPASVTCIVSPDAFKEQWQDDM
jgi:hypothetical protein